VLVRRGRIGIIALVLAFTLTACAGSSLLGWGETLDALGKQFVVTTKMYNSLHDSNLITDEEYRQYAEFARTFKVFYPQAVDAWSAFAECEIAGRIDCGSTQEVTSLILNLKTQLLNFYLAGIAQVRLGGN